MAENEVIEMREDGAGAQVDDGCEMRQDSACEQMVRVLMWCRFVLICLVIDDVAG